METPNAWFNREREVRAEEYRRRIERMIQDYTTEKSRKEEYRGRQLLELLQNADDAMEPLSVANGDRREVFISMQGNELVVANYGTAFGIGGLKSLMYAGNSEKNGDEALIGAKGLGMRSILNWAKELRIYSRDLAVRFSPALAHQFLEEEVIQGDEERRADIQSRRHGPTPIAIFAVPKDCDTPCPKAFAGFDTCLVITFDEGIRKEITDQFALLKARILLFLNRIDYIYFHLAEEEYSYSRTIASGTISPIEIRDSRDASESQTWNVARRGGEVPLEFLEEGGLQQRNFEIRLALPCSGEVEPTELFTFFPTRVGFPFPVCAHATLDLSGDRNGLIDSKANRYVLKQLAEFLLQWAMDQRHDPVDWTALRLVIAQDGYHEALRNLGFTEAFQQAFSKSALVPCLDGNYRSVRESRFYQQPFSKYLVGSKDRFPELVLWSERDMPIIQKANLSFGKYDPAEFALKLGAASQRMDWDDTLRAQIILEVNKAYQSVFSSLRRTEMPALFLTQTEEGPRQIASEVSAMFPPEKEGKDFLLSPRVPLDIIDRGLAKEIQKQSGQSLGQFVQNTKACFNLQEYEFDPIVRKVISAYESLPDSEFEGENRGRWVVMELFGVYKKREPANLFPKDRVSTFKIPARDGSRQAVNQLYFGQEFGNDLMEELLPGLGSAFVAGPAYFGVVEAEEKEFEAFLGWMGIERRPRWMLHSIGKGHFWNFLAGNPLNLQILQVYHGPNHLGDKIEFHRFGTINSVNCGSFQFLEQILKTSRFESIVAWLSSDLQALKALASPKEVHDAAEVEFWDSWMQGKANWRNIDSSQIPSYVLWKIRNTAWVPLHGTRVAPKECCLDSRISEFSDLFHYFEPDYKELNQKVVGLYEEKAKVLLRDLGFALRIQDLDVNSLYGVLLKVAENDANWKIAKSIYREVLEGLKYRVPSMNASELERYPNYKTYESSGRLWSYRIVDGVPVGAFRPISGKTYEEKIYYQNNFSFSRDAVGQLILMDMDRKKGMENIQKIFKVSLIDELKFDLRYDPPKHPAQQEFENWLEEFKPYLMIVRREGGRKDPKEELHKLKIHLCKELTAEFRAGDESPQSATLHDLEHFQPLSKKNQHYLSLAENNMVLNELLQDVKFLGAVAEIFSNQLGVEDVRKEVLWLFPLTPARRIQMLENEYGKDADTELRRAIADLGLADYREQSFWEAYWAARGGAAPEGHPDIRKLKTDLNAVYQVPMDAFDRIDYQQLNLPRNLPVFRQLFEPLGGKLNGFNEHYQRQPLHFQEEFVRLYKVMLTKCKASLKQQYGCYLQEVGDLKTWRGFLVDLEKIDGLQPKIDGFDLGFEASHLFEAMVRETLGFEFDPLKGDDPDFITHQIARLEEFRTTAHAYLDTEVSEFLRKKENLSLSYFIPATELFEQFVSTSPKRKVVQPNQTPTAPNVSRPQDARKEEPFDWTKLMEETLANLNLQTADDMMVASEISLPTGGSTSRPGSRTRRPPNWQEIQREKEKRGFQGELIAFEYLKRHGCAHLRWVSGNGLLAKALSDEEYQGELGYDLEYIADQDTSDERLKFVEVKSTTEESGEIHLTRKELGKALEHPEDYELIYITQLGTSDQRIHHWPEVFAFPEGRSLLNNDHFKVTFEDYVLHFRLE